MSKTEIDNLVRKLHPLERGVIPHLKKSISFNDLIKKSGMKASEFLRPFKLVPQSLKNLKNINKEVLSNETVTKLVNKKQKMLGNNGRILLRASGTEDLIRIMVESENKDQVAEVTNDIADKIIEQNDILKNK